MPQEKNCESNNRCIMEKRIEALEQANKSHSNTHEKMYDRIRNLETENAVQNAHYSSIVEKLDNLTGIVEELNGKAGKRWNSMIDKIAWLIVGGAVSLLLMGLGISV